MSLKMCPAIFLLALPRVLSSLAHIGHTQQHCKPPSQSIEAAHGQQGPLEAPAALPWFTTSPFFLFIKEKWKKNLSFHLISITYFLCHLHFVLHKRTVFQRRFVLWKRAGPYNAMVTVCRELLGGISLPPEHYTVVICNDLGADGTNTSSGRTLVLCCKLFCS